VLLVSKKTYMELLVQCLAGTAFQRCIRPCDSIPSIMFINFLPLNSNFTLFCLLCNKSWA
jgi:hypothetical protein